MPVIPALVVSVCLALAPVVSAQIVFGAAQSTPLDGTALPHFATGDLDGDGFDDLVVGNPGAPGLRLGDGAGHFGPEIPIDTDAAGGTVAVADMNGDEVLDLIVGSSQTSRLSVALGDGSGGFLPSLDSTLGGATIVNRLVLDVRDGDGDGDIDVLAVTPA
ncbi:MAG TPA: FG-GAP-like repeat-containing protein, partial [Planctomycetota bacterium]|nr:FG-GAP-like repeat-containing protein [Planctomycetota bacterium]